MEAMSLWIDEEINRLIQDLDSFVVKLELEEGNLIIYPRSRKVIGLHSRHFKTILRVIQVKLVASEISGHCHLILCFLQKDINDQESLSNFEYYSIPLKILQIKADIDPYKAFPNASSCA